MKTVQISKCYDENGSPSFLDAHVFQCEFKQEKILEHNISLQAYIHCTQFRLYKWNEYIYESHSIKHRLFSVRVYNVNVNNALEKKIFTVNMLPFSHPTLWIVMLFLLVVVAVMPL